VACLNIEKINDETLKRLRRRAQQRGRSLAEEVRTILEQAVKSEELPASRPDQQAMRAGDLATKLFGPAHGIRLQLPERQERALPDFSK